MPERKPLPKLDRQQRMQRAWELHNQFVHQTKIAEILGVDQSTISRWLKKVDEQVWDHYVVRAARLKAQDTFRLEKIIREAYAGWQRSCEDAVVVSVKTGGKYGDETTRTVKGQAGDPRFLDVILTAMKQLRELWGVARLPDEWHDGRGGWKPLEVIEAEIMQALEHRRDRKSESDGNGGADTEATAGEEATEIECDEKPLDLEQQEEIHEHGDHRHNGYHPPDADGGPAADQRPPDGPPDPPLGFA